MEMKCLVICILVISLELVSSDENSIDESSDTMVKTTQKCSQAKGPDNAIACYALSALNKLEDISTQDNIKILPGVDLSSDNPGEAWKTPREQRMLEIPTNTEGKISKIFDMMYNVVHNLFSGRTLKIKLPETTSNAVMRAFEEGRGKMKKLAGPLMMALGAKLIAVVPIMIGGLALLTAKALIISKLAVVIAILVGVQFLFSGGGNAGGLLGKFGQNGWNNNGNGGGGYNYYGSYGAPVWNGGSSQSYPYARSD